MFSSVIASVAKQSISRRLRPARRPGDGLPRRLRRLAMTGQAGFTLVEMLAVLAIIAVAGGAVAIGLGSGRGGSARGEAERLAAALNLASDEALVLDAPVRLTGDARGWEIDGAPAPVGGRRDLPKGVELEPAPEPVTLGEAAAPAEIGVAAGDERWTVRFDGLSAVAVAEGG